MLNTMQIYINNIHPDQAVSSQGRHFNTKKGFDSDKIYKKSGRDDIGAFQIHLDRLENGKNSQNHIKRKKK